MTTDKQIAIEGTGLKSPVSLLPMKAVAKLLFCGKTIFPGGDFVCDPLTASILVKKGLAEFGKPKKEKAVIKPKEHR